MVPRPRSSEISDAIAPRSRIDSVLGSPIFRSRRILLFSNAHEARRNCDLVASRGEVGRCGLSKAPSTSLPANSASTAAEPIVGLIVDAFRFPLVQPDFA